MLNQEKRDSRDGRKKVYWEGEMVRMDERKGVPGKSKCIARKAG